MEKITLKDFKKTRQYSNDKEALADMGCYTGEPDFIGAFIYNGVFPMDMNDKGEIALTLERTIYTTKDTPLNEMEFLMYEFLSSVGGGYIDNPEKDHIPEFDHDIKPHKAIRQWVFEMEKRELAYHYDDDPFDIVNGHTNKKLFNYYEAAKVSYTVRLIKKYDLDIFEVACEAKNKHSRLLQGLPLPLSQNQEDALKQVNKIKDAHNRLRNIWTEHNDEISDVLDLNYPYEKSFDEIGIEDWGVENAN